MASVSKETPSHPVDPPGMRGADQSGKVYWLMAKLIKAKDEDAAGS